MLKELFYKKFYLNISINLISRGFQKILNFISFLYIVNNVSPEILGNFQFVLSILMTVSIFSLNGMNISLIAAFSKKKNGFFLKATKLSFSYSFIGSIILIIFSLYNFINGENTMAICFIIASLLNPFFKGLLSWKVKKISFGKYIELSKIELLNSIILNLFLILSVIFYTNDQIYLVLISVLIPSLQNIILFLKERKLVTKNSVNKFRKETKYGFQYSVQEIFPIIAKEIDKIIIYFFLTPVSLGFYYILCRLPEFIKNFMQEIIFFIMPKFAKQKFYSNKLKKMTNFFNLISFLLIVLFAFTIYPIIYKLIFNFEYHQYLLMSQVLLCSLGFTTDVLIKGGFISTQLKIESFKRYTIFNSMIKIILSPILIYFFSIWGAVYAIVIQRVLTKIYVEYLLNMYHGK
jgi:O-antigen/teichoic acid export membrane protein